MDYAEIYKELKNYSIDDYQEFVSNVEQSYLGLASRPYTIDNSNCPIINHDSLTLDDLHDRFAILFNNVRFDCLITPKPDKAQSLFVIFSGSRDIDTDKLPVFKRWSYYRFVDSIVLNIADPMFYKYENLNLGWYYGNQNESYIEYLSKIIKKVQSLFQIQDSNLFFFGSSGGGYVTLQLSMYFQNTNHIAVNPQISIPKYHYASIFTQKTGIDLQIKDFFRRNETEQIIIERIKQNLNKFVIVQNVKDEHDCTIHLFPLLKKLDIDSLHLGVNSFNSLYVWLYSCLGGHNAQGDQYIFSYILYLADKISSNGEVTSLDEFVFKSVSILWKQKEYYLRLSKK